MFSSLEHQIESPVTFSSCNEVRVFIFRKRDFYRSFVSVVIAILNSPSDLARGVHNYCHLASRPSTCYLPPVVPSHAYSPYVMSPRDATPLVLFFFLGTPWVARGNGTAVLRQPSSHSPGCFALQKKKRASYDSYRCIVLPIPRASNRIWMRNAGE